VREAARAISWQFSNRRGLSEWKDERRSVPQSGGVLHHQGGVPHPHRSSRSLSKSGRLGRRPAELGVRFLSSLAAKPKQERIYKVRLTSGDVNVSVSLVYQRLMGT